MSLTVIARTRTFLPVEVEGITPDLLREKTTAEIERLEVFQGNRRLPFGELFQVSGDPSDGLLEFHGDLGNVHHIGRGMICGEIRVHGDAGRHLGAEMTGGMITVEGDVGDCAGAEMKGGVIRVAGSAGHRVGSAYVGSRRGMTDGAILIEGSAGDVAGASMRRGLLAVGGSCGVDVGFGMIAGTILIFGSCDGRPGVEMRRGTIGLFGPDPPPLPPTFRRAGRFRPLFMRLISRELDRLGFPLPRTIRDGEMTLYHGDLVSLGKGEIWLPVDGNAR